MVNNERPQFVLWLLIVIILVMGFMMAWQKIDKEARSTSLLVASQRMVERASYYKQEWLLSKQPTKLVIEGVTLTMSQAGWVMPIDQEKSVSCSFWLKVLYPDSHKLDLTNRQVKADRGNAEYQCEYTYSSEQVIVIQLVNDKFRVSVDFLTKD